MFISHMAIFVYMATQHVLSNDVIVLNASIVVFVETTSASVFLILVSE